MKNNKLSSTLILIFSIIVSVFLALFLPGLLLNIYTDSIYDAKKQVPPEYYANSASSVSLMASKQLSDYERMRLISGLWDCNIEEVPKLKGSEEYNIVSTAKLKINELAEADLYPYRIGEDDMYYWDVSKYNCIESNFETLSTSYWKISLVRYDNALTHDLLITDEGVILYLEYNGKPTERTIRSLSDAYRSLPITSERVCSYTPLSADDYVLSYKDTPLPDSIDSLGVLTCGTFWIQSKDMLEATMENNYESYEFYSILQSSTTSNDDNKIKYVYQIIPFMPNSASEK